VLKLEENIQIINKNIEEDKIGDNLDNINNIINNGYSLNEYSKQSLNNFITKKILMKIYLKNQLIYLIIWLKIQSISEMKH
jgi:hypothetical protein